MGQRGRQASGADCKSAAHGLLSLGFRYCVDAQSVLQMVIVGCDPGRCANRRSGALPRTEPHSQGIAQPVIRAANTSPALRARISEARRTGRPLRAPPRCRDQFPAQPGQFSDVWKNVSHEQFLAGPAGYPVGVIPKISWPRWLNFRCWGEREVLPAACG